MTMPSSIRNFVGVKVGDHTENFSYAMSRDGSGKFATSVRNLNSTSSIERDWLGKKSSVICVCAGRGRTSASSPFAAARGDILKNSKLGRVAGPFSL
jgi:hypothetical protein